MELFTKLLPVILATSTQLIDTKGIAALGAGISIGIAACGSAIGMGIATRGALEAGARQPEIFGKLQVLLITGIVFMESVAIYALVVSLLLIFTF